jgi:protein-arginine kinase activator protein McsA
MEEYRDMNLKQEDFEAAAIIYDNIRELYQEESAT